MPPINLRLERARRDTPKINGSTAGFVSLIAVLVLIIIISLAAVVIIIRKLRQPAISVGSAQRAQPDTSVAVGWKDTLTGVFQIGRGGIGSTRRTRGEQGWMRSGSGDQWDLNLAREDSQPSRQTRTPKNSSLTSSSLDPPFRPPTLAYGQSQSSTSSVLELNLPGPMFNLNPYTPINSVNPESSMVASTYTLPRSSSPEMAPGTPTKNGEDDTQGLWSRSTPSPNALGRTFHGGSKFIESL